MFNCPMGVAVDEDRNIIVADSGNDCIRKIIPQGQVGSSLWRALAIKAIDQPGAVAVDGDGNAIACD
jgi:DNA-binding beta-propeller fold protein YncE